MQFDLTVRNDIIGRRGGRADDKWIVRNEQPLRMGKVTRACQEHNNTVTTRAAPLTSFDHRLHRQPSSVADQGFSHPFPRPSLIYCLLQSHGLPQILLVGLLSRTFEPFSEFSCLVFFVNFYSSSLRSWRSKEEYMRSV